MELLINNGFERMLEEAVVAEFKAGLPIRPEFPFRD
jgi:hypothetical protein